MYSISYILLGTLNKVLYILLKFQNKKINVEKINREIFIFKFNHKFSHKYIICMNKKNMPK